jgi:alpha-mannosidase
MQKKRYLKNGSIKIVEKGPLRVSIELELNISKDSKLKQNIFLDTLSKKLTFQTFVDWNESYKILKVQFPTDIKSNHANFDIQFGHLNRPTNMNTSLGFINFK